MLAFANAGEMMVGELKLELLGGLHITLDGTALTGLRYAKAEALLCYLALSGRPHSRAALASLLWGESLDKDARNNLRGVLSKLQGALPEHLIVSRDSVAFNRESAYFLDVEVFLAKLQPEADAKALGEAVSLYRGDLLEGFYVRDAPEFEEWLAGERERLRQLVLQALHNLAVYYSERKDYAAGIGYVNRLLSFEPWREDAHRQLMLMLARSGQKDAALAQYKTCCRVLADEMGLDPSTETAELFQKIQTGEIATLRPPRHNLPLLPTALLGRHEELARVSELLSAPNCRLLTLIGAGGVGKTSLALQAAREALEAFPDGVFFVPLASIGDPDLVLAMIAQALSVREASAQALFETIKASLRDKKMLLLLDNLEHLPEAAPVVSELLASCPELKVIATSRAVLNLRGEHELEVPPLAVPDLRHIPGPEALLAYPAVALFYERAKAVKPDFRLTGENAAATATVCVRLDGLPLAIELAAARVKFMSLEALLIRLRDRLKFLTGGARDLPAHQQTLRNTIAWSYELLEPDVQVLFARLAVFVGSFSLEAAEEVCAAPSPLNLDAFEGVTRLVDKSLLRREDSSGEVRFWMLETLREYGLERLKESGEEASLHDRHAAYYQALVEEAAPELVHAEQASWLERLEREHDNLRVALGWYLDKAQADKVIHIGWALWRYWWVRGHLTEGQNWMERALAMGESLSEEARAQGLVTLALLLYQRGDMERASSLLEESLKLTDSMTLRLKTFTHGLYGYVALSQAAYARARHHFAEVLALSQEQDGLVLSGLAQVELREGNFPAAAAHLKEGEAMLRTNGDFFYLTTNLNIQGLMMLFQGNYARAEELFRESLTLAHRIRITLATAYALKGLACSAAMIGEAEKAARLFSAAEALREARGIQQFASEGIRLVYEHHVATLRAKLDEKTFSREWTLGRHLPLDEVVALALERDDGSFLSGVHG
ncbi:MAG: AAA family ATPase [Bradymonadaceae bacterium]|nr:AAA family ATPase [Lujinxingiaceae bacterium]